MNKFFISLIAMLAFSGCSIFDAEVIVGNVFSVGGIVYNSEQTPLESVRIKVISIDASEGHKSLSKVGIENLTDDQGEYYISAICNTAYTISPFTKKKLYKLYKVNDIRVC